MSASAIPDRYRGRDVDDLALLMLADALDPPAAEVARGDPESWRAAVADAQVALGLAPPFVVRGAPPTRRCD